MTLAEAPARVRAIRAAEQNLNPVCTYGLYPWLRDLQGPALENRAR
jgi:hypothetical protein